MFYATDVKKVFSCLAQLVQDHCQRLGELDAAMGDGDLGVNMQRGFVKAAKIVAELDGSPGGLLKAAGMGVMQEAPSTLGTLIGKFLLGMCSALPPDADRFSFEDFLRMYALGYEALQKRAKAELGEKTILDTLWPAFLGMQKAYGEGAPPAECFKQGYEASLEGLEKSNHMKAVHGRPAYFGEKTVGMQDGGATMGTLLVKSLLCEGAVA